MNYILGPSPTKVTILCLRKVSIGLTHKIKKEESIGEDLVLR